MANPIASSVPTHHAANVAAGRIERDDAQLTIVEKLAQLEQRISQHNPPRNSLLLGCLCAAAERAQPSIKGVYIFGDVGRARSVLIDMFFETSPVQERRRAHFHAV